MGGFTIADGPRLRLKRRRRIIVIVVVLASLFYILQAFTPLRLTSDGIAYLSFADSALQGQGLQAIAQNRFSFPKGYPVFLFGMMKTGIFSSATLVISNLIFFGLALVLSRQSLVALGFESEIASLSCLLTYLSYAAIKHITQAMSDFLYFFLAAFAFWLLTRKGPSRWLAVIPGLCAAEVRLLGLALFVPISFLVWQWAAKRPKILIPLCAVVVGCLGIGVWAGRRYFAIGSLLFRHYGMLEFARLSAATHCLDFGQLIFNLPWTKLPTWTLGLIIGTGAIGILLFILGVVALYKSSPLVSFYLAASSALILPWPYTDPRFWVPIMPYMVVAIWAAIIRIRRSVPNWTVLGYTALFSMAGFAALGYSSWITFSGPNFPYRYGDGELRRAYIAGCSGSADPGNPAAINLLRRYEWKCGAKQ